VGGGISTREALKIRSHEGHFVLKRIAPSPQNIRISTCQNSICGKAAKTSKMRAFV
jgi:hypothetical protein